MPSDLLERPALVAGSPASRERVVAVLAEHEVAVRTTATPWVQLGVDDALDAELVVVCGELADAQELAALRSLRARCSATRIVVVVPGPEDARVARRAMRARVDGVVFDTQLEIALVPTIAAVLVEQVVMPRRSRPQLPMDLSSREREILAHVARGSTNAVIAAQLDVAESTVKSHLTRVFAKLGVYSRAEAVRLMLESDGLATHDPQAAKEAAL